MGLKTQSDVFSLPVPDGKPRTTARGQISPWNEAVYFDEGDRKRISGLGLRVRAGGVRSWVYFHRWAGKQVKLTIGPATEYTLAQARERVEEIKVESRRQQKSPSEIWKFKQEPASQEVTLGDVVPLYLDARHPTKAKSDRLRMTERGHEEARRYLERYWKPLHSTGLASINRDHITKRLDEITAERGAITADRARTALSGLFAWQMEADAKLNNPVNGSRRHGDNDPRERTLTDDELATVWKACDGVYGNIVRLLILTLCRREEIAGLRWSEIHALDRLGESEIRLPGSRTKNGRDHVVPLSEAAAGILRAIPRIEGQDHVFGAGKTGFSSFSYGKAALDEKVALPAWTIHDLRRTGRTGLGRLGVAPHVAEACLNHLPPKLVRTYDQHTYAAEKRAALDAWATHVLTVLARADGANVVPLRG